MRLITFILSFAIALTSIPVCASAGTGTSRQAAFSCPAYEGYPDCSNVPGTASSRSWRSNR
jgi:hypothetical protein